MRFPGKTLTVMHRVRTCQGRNPVEGASQLRRTAATQSYQCHHDCHRMILLSFWWRDHCLSPARDSARGCAGCCWKMRPRALKTGRSSAQSTRQLAVGAVPSRAGRRQKTARSLGGGSLTRSCPSPRPREETAPCRAPCRRRRHGRRPPSPESSGTACLIRPHLLYALSIS